jgi:hypothetical protein
MVDQIEVTQADRAEAAAYYYSAGGSPVIADAIRRGEKDGWFRVQAFARHRLAGVKAMQEAAAKCCEWPSEAPVANEFQRGMQVACALDLQAIRNIDLASVEDRA